MTTTVRLPKPRDEAYKAARAAAESHLTGLPTRIIDRVVDAALQALRRHRPPIVALLAAGQHSADLTRAEWLLAAEGAVMLTPVFADRANPPDLRTRQALQNAQQRKLMLADVVVVLAPDQQIGPWLQDLIRYARSQGKPVQVVGSAETALPAAGYPHQHPASARR